MRGNEAQGSRFAFRVIVVAIHVPNSLGYMVIVVADGNLRHVAPLSDRMIAAIVRPGGRLQGDKWLVRSHKGHVRRFPLLGIKGLEFLC